MKRILSTLIVSTFLVGASTSFAAPAAYDSLKGGLKDVVTSPSHITDNVKAEADSAKFLPLGVVGGLSKGTFYMGKQVIDGAWKIATIPYHMVK